MKGPISKDNERCTPLDLAIMFGHGKAATSILTKFNKTGANIVLSLNVAVIFKRVDVIRLAAKGVQREYVDDARGIAEHM
jgi:hypothetical protein